MQGDIKGLFRQCSLGSCCYDHLAVALCTMGSNTYLTAQDQCMERSMIFQLFGFILVSKWVSSMRTAVEMS
jgi:hypothetical protein